MAILPVYPLPLTNHSFSSVLPQPPGSFEYTPTSSSARPRSARTGGHCLLATPLHSGGAHCLPSTPALFSVTPALMRHPVITLASSPPDITFSTLPSCLLDLILMAHRTIPGFPP